jgi:hypothetical protein
MPRALRAHELMDGRQRVCVIRFHDDLTTAREISVAVLDHVPLPRHHRRARHRLHVNELRSGEVACLKGVLDQPEVRSNLRDAERVI